MPSSASRTFTDPDKYFAGIRNLQIEGVITKRGEFCAEFDAHRSAPPVDASLRREPASDHENNAERETGADPLRDRSPSADDAGQRDRSIARSNRNVRVGLPVLPSILWGLRMGHHVADARGPCRRQRGHHWAPRHATLIPSMDQPSCTRYSPAVAIARSGGPPCEDRSRHSREARSSASDRGGFGRSNDLVPDRGPFRRCAQCPSPSSDASCGVWRRS